MNEKVDLPSYDELPAADGPGRSAWGLFGEDDNIGLLNLQTDAGRLRAAASVKTGRMFALDIPLDFFGPPATPGGRGAPEHVLYDVQDFAFDDYLNGFFLQGTSQWDALGHVSYKPGVFYNGVSTEDIKAGRRNTIDHWARRGIGGRAIMLDVARTLAAQGRPIDPLGNYAITVEDLEATRIAAGVEYEVGDIILLRTGHTEALAALPVESRRTPFPELKTPGLDHTEDMVRYIWNTHACAIAADNMAVEVWPSSIDLMNGDRMGPTWPFGYTHNVYIGLFGLVLGEYFWLADVAAECAQDGRYEMLFTSAPLNTKGVGSPPNAIVIK